MFELFRQIFRVFYSAQMSFVVLLLAFFLPAVAVGNLLLLLLDGKYDEAGPAVFLVLVAGGMVAFVIWVRRDAIATGERLERRLRKKIVTEWDDEEQDDDDDDVVDRHHQSAPPSPEQI